jgi:hypothetical protein
MSAFADRQVEKGTSPFSGAELERLLDWYKALGACHDVVPSDDRLADKIGRELARLRASRS